MQRLLDVIELWLKHVQTEMKVTWNPHLLKVLGGGIPIPVSCADPGGATGALAPPPSPQNIAPPNSEARAKRALAPPPPGAKGALAPPYKILDPPMGI